MMKRTLIAALLVGCISLSANDKSLSIGVVDFGKCIESSKLGMTEQANFEMIKSRMHKAIEDIDSQLADTSTKLQDKDLLDSLSPEAENELKMKFQALNEEMSRYQGQYYQVMQQANMKLVQTMAQVIGKASENVAEKNKLSVIINREAAFHYSPKLDVTEKVISELDTIFEKEADALQASGQLPQLEDLDLGK